MKKPVALLFKDHSQYDVLGHFAEAATLGFTNAGYDVDIVDFRSPSIKNDLQSALNRRPSLALAFNAIGYNIKDRSGQSIFDACNVPFCCFLVDHPMYHLIRLDEPNQNRLVLCVDPSHLNFLERCYDNISAACIPHGGLPCFLPEIPFTERDIPLLFCGSGYQYDGPEKILKNLPEEPRHFLTAILEECLTRPDAALTDVAAQHLTARRGDVPRRLFRNFAQGLITVDQFLIATRRNQLLSSLHRAGIPLQLYGNHWEHSPFASSNLFQIHPAVDCSTMLQLMRRARIVLNMVPSFPSGTHERVFTAMLHGAVSLTHRGTLTEELFTDHQDILFYDWNHLDASIERLRPLLNNGHALAEIARSGTAAAREQTWGHRIASLLEIIQR
ncbi:MAG: glycosyltransferase [Kiritimatiellae bacterium]|nr:glycosyltransferase [Kiritimatiellia bacterium]